MEIVVSYEQGAVPVTVFYVRGEIDSVTYAQLQDRSRAEIDRGTHYLVLDLSGVSRVTSASIRALMYIFHALRTDAPEDSDAALRSGMKAGTFRSRHLKLARPIPHIREVLCLAGVNNFLEIYDTLPAAIDSFQA